MAEASFLNANGLLVRFGKAQGKRGAKTAVTTSTTKRNEMAMEVDLAGAARTIFSTDRNNDGTNDGFSGLDTPLPANCLIKDVQVIILTTPVGGTSFQVGTFNLDGTAIDDDGILAAGTTAAAGAAGAQVGTQLAANSYVAVKTIGTYTAGKIKVIVNYVIR